MFSAALLVAVICAAYSLFVNSSDHGGGHVRVSGRDPRYFETSDGEVYVPIGLNLASMRGDLENEGQCLQTMRKWLDSLADNGGNFARVWIGWRFWDVEHERAGQYDRDRARRLDRLLEMARQRGIRLKLTIETFREIDPAKADTSWAMKPLHHASRGGPARSMAEWVDGEAGRDMFRRKLRWYAQRYVNEPAIFGWELWNEMDTVQGGDIMPWSLTMLAQLHRLFPRHLCMQSLGSFDTAQKRELYRHLCAMPGNDVAQVHRYLDLGAPLGICHGPVDVLAADAVRELRRLCPDRPILLAESGAVEPTHTGPFRLYERDTDGIILHDVLFAPFFAGAAGTGNIWHWAHYVDGNDLWWHFGRFARAVAGVVPPAEGFAPHMLDHDRLRVYTLRGRRTVLVWCRDTQSDWRAELQEQAPPAELRQVTLDARELAGGTLPKRVRTYDPWQDEWTELGADETALVLPPFRRSIVVRMDVSH